MKRWMFLLSTLALVSACEKFDDLEPLTNTSPNNSLLSQTQCKGNMSKETVHRSRVFYDGFDDAIPGDSCYTQAPTCVGYLEWFMSTECPKNQDFSGLKHLNKCTWRVWTGFNFWSAKDNQGVSTYSAASVNIKDGMAVFTIKPNPNYVASKGGCRSNVGGAAGTPGYHDLNCPLIIGAIDSNYTDAQRPGRTPRFGRIEIKAKYVRGSSRPSAYPALWMWPAQGKHNESSKPKGTPLGEIDILEYDDSVTKDVAFQSYHNWGDAGLHGWNSKQVMTEMTTWHRYGVDWEPTRLRFYIDDCIVNEINEGDLATAGNRKHHFSISDAGSFMMLALSVANSPSDMDLKANDQLWVDEVSIFE